MSNTFNAANYVDQLPSNIRTQVLYSLVGSLNASLISSAQSMIRRIEVAAPTSLSGYEMGAGVKVSELSPYEVKTLLAGMDNQDGTAAARNVNVLAQHWRDDLIGLTDRAEAGSLSGTLDFMIASPRKVDDDLLAATLAAAGLVDAPVAVIKARYDEQQRQRAEQLAAKRGEIEWLIEQALSDHDDDGYMTDAGAVFSNMDENIQERIGEKLLAALERTRDTAVVAVLNRDRRWSFGDLPVIGAAIAEVKDSI